VLGAEQLSDLYGVAVQEPNVAILMRHRAVLFALLAAFLATAAFTPALHTIALIGGTISVASFLLLAWSVGGYNAALSRVITADAVALVLLGVGGAARIRSRKSA
jgi:Cu/Ag efflux pump CusA